MSEGQGSCGAVHLVVALAFAAHRDREKFGKMVHFMKSSYL